MNLSSIWQWIHNHSLGVPFLPEKEEKYISPTRPHIPSVTLSARRLGRDYTGDLVITTYRFLFFLSGSSKTLFCKFSAVSPEYTITEYRDFGAVFCQASDSHPTESFSFQLPLPSLPLLRSSLISPASHLGQTFVPNRATRAAMAVPRTTVPKTTVPKAVVPQTTIALIGFEAVAKAAEMESARKAEKLKIRGLEDLKSRASELISVARELREMNNPEAQAIWREMAGKIGAETEVESAEGAGKEKQLAKEFSRKMAEFWRKAGTPMILSAAEAYACFIRMRHSNLESPKDFKRMLDYIQARPEEFEINVSKLDEGIFVMKGNKGFDYFRTWLKSKLDGERAGSEKVYRPIGLLMVTVEFGVPRDVALLYLKKVYDEGWIAVDEHVSGTQYYLNRFGEYLSAI